MYKHMYSDTNALSLDAHAFRAASAPDARSWLGRQWCNGGRIHFGKIEISKLKGEPRCSSLLIVVLMAMPHLPQSLAPVRSAVVSLLCPWHDCSNHLDNVGEDIFHHTSFKCWETGHLGTTLSPPEPRAHPREQGGVGRAGHDQLRHQPWEGARRRRHPLPS